VVEVPQQLHLTQRPQTEHGVVEGCDLLDGDLLARRLVQRRAVSVSAMVSPWGPVVVLTILRRMRLRRLHPGCRTAQIR
jgi:hypothetical protein